jgi:hypothetical protein
MTENHTKKKVHEYEREDRAGMTWCNTQTNWLNPENGYKITHNNQKDLIELELGRSATATSFSYAHQR